MNNKKDIKRVLQRFEEFKNKLSVVVPKLENIKNSFEEKNKEIKTLIEKLTVISNFISTPDLLITKLKQIEKIGVFFRKFGDLSNYPDELHEFRNDLNKFEPGMFLWMEKKYPHISEIHYILDWKSPVLRINNINKIVNQYFKLHEKVKAFYPQLYEEEYNDTVSFFKNEVRPINFIIEYLSYKKLNNFLMSESLDDIKKFLDNLPELTKFIQEKRLFQIKKEDIPPKIRDLSKKMERDNTIADELISDISSDPHFIVKVLLDQIQNFDSFNINFIKFLIRLKHIFETGNRNYKKHYSLKSEFTDRGKIREELMIKFFDEFKDFRRFLLNYLNQFKKLRHICSHRTPKPKLSKNKKYALIYIPKKMNFMKLRIEKTKKLVLTYAYFIRALNI